MGSEKKEITKFEQAIDLKAKVTLLLKACSEVSNYLTPKIDGIQKIDSQVAEAARILDATAKEKESMDRALKLIKAEYENKKKEIEEMTASANKQVSQMKADAAKSWDEAQTIMIMTKARETEASLKFEEADNLRRELENKLASIAKIGGK